VVSSRSRTDEGVEAIPSREQVIAAGDCLDALAMPEARRKPQTMATTTGEAAGPSAAAGERGSDAD
jgi:hypothetical protein